ncbi:MAG: helix-hairpin-helix domain-containing protein [Anaerolineae bacterium]
MAANRININRATVEELESLPGIGPALAKAIVELRERRGPFQSVEDLLPIRGIGPVLVERLRPLVTFEGEALRRPMKDETEPDVRPVAGPEVIVEEEPELMRERSIPLTEDAAHANATTTAKERTTMVGEEYPLPPPLQVVESGRLTLWKGLLLVVLGGLLGAVLSLLVVWAVNRTLFFTSYDFGSHLNAEVVRLQGQNEIFRQELDLTNQSVQELRDTVRVIPQIQSDVTALQGQTAKLEQGLESAQKRVDELAGQVQDISRQVSAMQEELKAVSEKAKRFDAFLAGLLELLKQTAPAP